MLVKLVIGDIISDETYYGYVSPKLYNRFTKYYLKYKRLRKYEQYNLPGKAGNIEYSILDGKFYNVTLTW